ncbi:DUF992 domain-containing protein [Rhodoblastus acidophilus]|uniref:DUF992 domain-containing protein n=1 Tax=Rhodoblastus acidophilus TaxID=1074 RepID=A0A6N8DHQ9_RHOAC|nr:DUF992 domain-containing protein [Rhodoblastus acidophilus]MCW2272966.1 hypothetical protein [Rhodoblastus acidophilus]MTV29869.1 DUF992 domain-containing protein [Rhodoblastus acidophilus]
MAKKFFVSSLALACICGALPAAAQSTVVGALSCDVSAGVGLILTQKQTLRCVFKPANGGPGEAYTGRIDEYGVALGGVAAGHLIWAVLAPNTGLPRGALAGTYAGVGAEATAGVGLGANVLVGGTGRAFSLQPVSVEGQIGVNVAAGVTTVTLVAAP